MFPLPITALQQLVTADFLPLLDNAPMSVTTTNNDIKGAAIEGESLHGRTVRAIANAIWKKAQKNKKKSSNSNNNRDELHANSLYTCLCGNIDNKSLDCFGITLLVVIGMNILGSTNSTLTLSEDHAFESHQLYINDDNDDARVQGCGRATCEVAISGNTKDIYRLNVVKKYHAHLLNQRMVYQLIIHGYTCLRIQYYVTIHV